MPPIVYEIFNLIASLIRLIGMAVLGLGIGWLVLDLLHKAEEWQFKAIVFLGLIGLLIATFVFIGWGAHGAFALGVGVSFFLWGMPKKPKQEEEKKK